MKKHITIEQLNELNAEGKEKLKEWWESEEGDWVSVTGGAGDFEVCLSSPTAPYWQGSEFKNSLLLPSIGQMIELISEECYLRFALNRRVDSMEPVWRMEIFNYGESEGKWCEDWNKSSDICDVLWQATKEILETDEK